jgi:NADH-quinone oxidoreductase subunit M
MVNHALVTAPLFFIVAALALRAGGSEKLSAMGGIAFRAPVLAALFLIVTLATLAMPGSANFVGEFLILLGLFKAKMVVTLIASIGVVGAAVYALRLYIASMHNRVRDGVTSREITLREALPIAPLVAVILFLAVYPQFGLKRSQSSVATAVAPAQVAHHLYEANRIVLSP